MDLYTLNEGLRRERVIDYFESLIWTERASAVGDFEVVIESTKETRTLLKPETYLAINESHRVMQIENVENKEDDEGRLMLHVSGRSLEKILMDRVSKATMSNLTTDPAWVLTATPGDIARTVFHNICVLGQLSSADIIPFYTAGNFFPLDTMVEPDDASETELKPGTVYDVIKELCDNYRLGFRLVRYYDTGQLYFNVYAGADRTSQQTYYPSVIFSPDLDNLKNPTEFNSTANVKNVAYVFSKNGAETVYADNTETTISGLDRKVLFVEVSTDEPAGAALTAMLQKKGKEELSKYRALAAFDGETSQFSSYKYGVDYNLGDLVEMRNEDGVTNYMRVTEQIFVSDAEGDRSYPTLTVDRFITPGSWLAWDYNQEWADGGATEYWVDA